MNDHLFFKLGQWIYQLRWAIIFIWVTLICCCIPFMSHLMTPFQATGFSADGSESVQTKNILDQTFGNSYNRILVLYHAQSNISTDPSFDQNIHHSFKNFHKLSLEHTIIYPTKNNHQISKDQHTAYAVILLKDPKPISHDTFITIEHTLIKPPHMRMLVGGEAAFVENVNLQTEKDLYKSDMIAAPVSIIALLIIFGTVVAAVLPMCLGGGCALMILSVLFILGHYMNLSIFTLNIALLLGLCLSLDYALFIIYRFREELHAGHNVKLSIARTLATAGKAIFFSGLAVFISLSALLFFPINILFSVGVGGLTAVFMAMAMAITLLPALLSVLKECIDCLAFRCVKTKPTSIMSPRRWNLWHKIAIVVIKHPFAYCLSSLCVLLVLGFPFLHVHFGMADEHTLPAHSESRQFFDAYTHAFNAEELAPILAVIQTQKGDILSKKNLSALYDLYHRLEKNKFIKKIDGVVPEKNWTKAQYQAVYTSPQRLKNPNLKQLLKLTTDNKITVFTIISRYPATSPQTQKLISKLRHMHLHHHLTMKLTGTPVNEVDVFQSILKNFPYAITWIIALTYLILMVLLQSLFLPLKAILMNMLSLCASYGVLVFIFQDGHFHHALNFYPQGMLDISLLIIIFCALFGFSMDYEVFLLTRIQEHYLKTKNNDESIIFGIIKSSQIITSAAMIVICLCGSFMIADVLIVKEFGLGIAVAIFVDAFIIRTILVPSTMALLKKWNWYFPKRLRWTARIHGDHEKN